MSKTYKGRSAAAQKRHEERRRSYEVAKPLAEKGLVQNFEKPVVKVKKHQTINPSIFAQMHKEPKR